MCLLVAHALAAACPQVQKMFPKIFLDMSYLFLVVLPGAGAAPASGGGGARISGRGQILTCPMQIL